MPASSRPPARASWSPPKRSYVRVEGRDYEAAGQLLERVLAERRSHWEAQEKPRGKYKEPVAPDTPPHLPELPEGLGVGDWWRNYSYQNSNTERRSKCRF